MIICQSFLDIRATDGARQLILRWATCWQGVEFTPEEKGGSKVRDDDYGSLYNIEHCIGLKVAPTVFDQTSAMGSAGLIASCGALTLFLRYFGSIFLD